MPSKVRVLVAFLAASAIAALALATFETGYDGFQNHWERVWRTAVLYGIFGAYPTALLFGIPAYLILRHRIAPSLLNCVLAGAVTAGLPWFLYSMLAWAAVGSSSDYGWLQFIGEIAAFGALGGLMFWLIATGGRLYGRKATSDVAT